MHFLSWAHTARDASKNERKHFLLYFCDQDVNDKLSPDQLVNGTDPSSQEFEKSSTSFAGKHVITVRDSHHVKSLKKRLFFVCRT